MILNVRHTGIVVNNLQRMAGFYRALGFVEVSHDVETGSFIEQVVHLDGVTVEWIKMKAPDGYLLELLKYHSHPNLLEVGLSSSNELGCSHMAFTVDNIDKVSALVVQNGGTITNQPALSPNGKVKVVYCHDPEGVLIEMVEDIS